MELYIFCTRDKKLGAWNAPYLDREDKEHHLAMSVRSLARVPSDQIAYAKDQALYYLGYFDDEQGKFVLLPEPEKLVDFEDYIIGEKA